MTGTDSDAALVSRVADGDREAFATLVNRHQAAVFRLAKALAGESAEDVLQETFVALWRHADSFSGQGSVRHWLLTIARNEAYRRHRRRAGEPQAFEPLDELGARAGWGQPTPESLMIQMQRREAMQRALDRLPPQAREVLILRDLEEFTGPEVAELLDVSLSAVKSRLHRARLAFVANLREEASNEG